MLGLFLQDGWHLMVVVVEEKPGQRDPKLAKQEDGFPGGASGKEPACQCGRQKRRRFSPWVGKIPRGSNGNAFQYSCLENPHGQSSLGGYSP